MFSFVLSLANHDNTCTENKECTQVCYNRDQSNWTFKAVTMTHGKTIKQKVELKLIIQNNVAKYAKT